LASLPAFPATHDIVAQVTDGVITVESQCGNIPVSYGDATASFISQNTPNPFGGSGASVTTLPFDIGADGSVVTIRVLNAAGAEVFKPVDHVVYSIGRYVVPVRASDVGSGAFFYEFHVEGMKPQMLKMTVE
jgi:hypothetical protein